MKLFAKKEKSRDVAVKRLNSFVRSANRDLSKNMENKAEEIKYMVDYIKDYAYRNLEVEKNDVKVHVTKEGNSLTLVASIFYDKSVE